MEVRPGYKQTEVGVIPEHWEIGRLGRFWAVTDCKHVTAKFVDIGFPIASILEVQSRFVDLTHAKQTTQGFYRLLTDGGRGPKAGDLILSRNATVGEVAQVAEWHPPFAMGQDVCLLRKESPQFSTDYLQAVFRSPIIASQLSDLMVGSTFKRVNVQQIKNLIIPMPSSIEQHAIAAALSDVDALISGLDRLIEKKRAIKQGAMQELLTGKRRLPGFSGEWEAKTIGSLFEFLGTANNPRSDLSTGGNVEYVHYGDVHTRWKTFLDCGGTTLPFIRDDKVRNVPLLEDGDLVMVDASEDYAGVGVSVEIKNVADRRIVAGLHTLLLRGNKEDLADGFKGYLQYIPALKDALIRVATGVSVYGLLKRNMEGISIRLPKVTEQTAIATVLSDMDVEIAALEARRDKTRLLKEGMMQELLTGRIRLNRD